ncbi:MAG: DNA polymerase subunit beta [Methanomicrobiales archaeon]|jgi:predicted nucleotidyltransferase|nr:DNA polymerase subunit beta [Methanomicrobiales archaeon]
MKQKTSSEIRLRDFVRDAQNWIYSVTAYDNNERVGCLLRYIPDTSGDRVSPDGVRYRKVGFEEAYEMIAELHPSYAGLMHRIPLSDITQVYKPDREVSSLAEHDDQIKRLMNIFSGLSFGVTGSRVVGLGGAGSDIDGVVYGTDFSTAQIRLKEGIKQKKISDLSDELWKAVYKKRDPELSYDDFLAHEARKWNRGQIDETYFDLLYVRSYAEMIGYHVPIGKKGKVEEVEAIVTDAQYAYDSPAIYAVDHPEYDAVVSFTHTYAGQAVAGEQIKARGVTETHTDGTRWLVIGSTRVAKGEYIKSQTLLESL